MAAFTPEERPTYSRCFTSYADYVDRAARFQARGPISSTWRLLRRPDRKYGEMTQAWSLGVEEKCYLLWPPALSRVKRSKLIKALFVAPITRPRYRPVLSHLGDQKYTWFAFDTHLEAVVLGSLIALLAKQGWRALKWLTHPATPLCALVCVLVFQQISDLVTYLIAIFLIYVICRPPRLLNNPDARHFRAISYSPYPNQRLP